MADFAAVLRKTLGNMAETTPEMREKVYEKARATIKRQIDALDVAPPQAAIDRQFAKLEDAINAVEADFSAASDDVSLEEALAATIGPEDEKAVLPEVSQPAPKPDATSPEVPGIQPSETGPGDAFKSRPIEQTVETGAGVSEETAENVPETVNAASDDLASVFDEVSNMHEETEPDARDVFDDRRFEIGGANDADDDDGLGQVSAAYEDVRDEVSKPAADPLAEFIKEHELSTDDRAGTSVEEDAEDFNVPENSRSSGIAAAAVPGVGTDRAYANRTSDEAGFFDNERRGDAPYELQADENKGGGAKRIVILALIAALLGGGGYLAYAKQNEIQAFYSGSALPWWQNLTGGSTTQTGNVLMEDGVPVRTVTSTNVDPNMESSGEEPAPSVVEDVSNQGEVPVKFTQRLSEDGTEIDEGPVDGMMSSDTGEGSSVAPQTADGENSQTAQEAPGSVDDTSAAPLATPVGQRAIFYEERTGTEDGRALAGATVWSVANVSPGNGLPIEPAVRAETSIPELGLTMEMTIRRNGDTTFPASHIIELFFRVPETFSGRGIADVQRMNFKTNEQDPGSALFAVAAPIEPNIFLIALNDAATAIESNVQLMQRENWIDIPMQYTNGRRALITLEKGIPGERVFNEVFEAWEANPLNN